MLTIELDICSGMPNPTWDLSADQEKELLDRIMANPAHMKPVNLGLSHLGYKGMIVHLSKEDDGAWTKMRNYTLSKTPNTVLPTEFRVFGDLSDSVNNVEKWFVETSDTADSEVDEFLREFLAGGFTFPVGQELEGIIIGQDEESVEESSVSPLGAGMSCAKSYFTGTDFSFWNGSSYVGKNNCYNFAGNRRQTTQFAQPGRKAGVSNGMTATGTINTSTFLSAVRADGWKDSCDVDRNLCVVLVFMPYKNSSGTVINPINDYHWYRRVTSGGTFGHKPGGGNARSTDSSNKTITDPLTCDRRLWYNNKWYPGYTMTNSTWYFYWDNNNANVK